MALNFNHATNTISSTSGSVAITGLSGAGFSTTDDTSTNASYYPVIVTAAGGSTAKTSSTKVYFNPSTGTLYSTLFQAISDQTVKKDITLITNGLETVNKLNGVEFNWVDNGKPSAGVIAQELENVLPNLISIGDNELKSVNYLGIIGYLIEAIKELNLKVEKLENR